LNERSVEYMQPHSLELETLIQPSPPGYFSFGSRGKHEEILHLHEETGGVVAITRGATTVTDRWSDLWEMLLGEASRLSSRFDNEGRRVPRLQLLDRTE
jgi:hypothetical protein